MKSDNDAQGGPIMRRAREVATGFADVGLSHAEEMLRRLSPEGREQARREREARARRQRRLLVRLVLAAVATLLAWAMLSALVAPGAALAVAAAVMLLLTMLIFMRAAPAVPGREALAEAALPALAEEAAVWIAAQRRGLPAPAVALTDTMNGRLEELAPRLDRLDPRSPAADAVRKLIAVELPDLVESWRSVPPSMRRTPGADGRSADDHLTNGLRLIDTELERANEQLAQGSRDSIAVHGRYLELKYDPDQGRRGP